MELYYLVFDLGTGNSKISIVSSSGDIIGMKSLVNKYIKDNNYSDAQFFLPQEWEPKLLKSASELLNEFPDIKISAITASGARQSIVLYDDDGFAFLGLPNIDNRGREWMRQIENKPEIYKKTGKWVTEDFPAAKLMGFRKKYPKKNSIIKRITSLSEWIGAIFCDKIVIEPSQACETQLFDINKMEWSKKICNQYGINYNILPNIEVAGTNLGFIKPELKKRLSINYDIPFIVGGADTQLAVKSSNCSEGEIVFVSGTTSPIIRVEKTHLHDPKQRCWVDCDLGGENYLIETNPGVTGLNYQRFKQNFLTNYTYQELENLYRDKTNYSCTASFSSLLFSQQRSLKVGGFFIKSPLSPDINIIDLAWGVLCDIAFSIYEEYLSLCLLIPFEKTYIRCCGGGFQSNALCQLLADLTGKELILSNNYYQASILGCVKVCNAYYDLFQKSKNEFITYHPRKNDNLKKTYKEWSRNRKLLNP